MKEIQGNQKLSDTWFHGIEGHCLSRGHFHQKICAHSQRLVNKTDMTVMRALYIKVVEKLANEVPAWMFRFRRIHVLVDVQLSLVFLSLARHVDLKNNICRLTVLFYVIICVAERTNCTYIKSLASQTVEVTPYPILAIAWYLSLKISPWVTG